MSNRSSSQAVGEGASRLFDLNVDKVLEHWGVAEGIREVIANAFDEQALTATADPVIFKDIAGWHIRDYGRGLKYEHLTQNENPEKLRRGRNLVVGKFGVGLKDALATFDRRKVGLKILSPYGDIELRRAHKHGFDDVETLHALVESPSQPERRGTEFVLNGVSDAEIETAKGYFLRFSGDEELERTEYGSVLVRAKGRPGSIYVKGLRVATEDAFLFSYNVTSVTAALQKALNRERTNVGRSAYQDRVKAILLRCETPGVANELADDLARIPSGTNHDEVTWLDVQERAIQILAAKGRAVFVTADQMYVDAGLIEKAKMDGYRVVVVPDRLASRLPGLRDLEGNQVLDIGGYVEEWNRSFEFDFVDPVALNQKEKRIWEWLPALLKVASPHSKRVKTVVISNTLRIDRGGYETEGLWEDGLRRIVIKRSALDSLRHFAQVILHEVGHASSNGSDHFTREFESRLDELLGITGAEAAQANRDGS
jgi:hypothetical protein